MWREFQQEREPEEPLAKMHNIFLIPSGRFLNFRHLLQNPDLQVMSGFPSSLNNFRSTALLRKKNYYIYIGIGEPGLPLWNGWITCKLLTQVWWSHFMFYKPGEQWQGNSGGLKHFSRRAPSNIWRFVKNAKVNFHIKKFPHTGDTESLDRCG